MVRSSTRTGPAVAAAYRTWTAPIVMLLVKFLQKRSTRDWNLFHILALLRKQLLLHDELMVSPFSQDSHPGQAQARKTWPAVA